MIERYIKYLYAAVITTLFAACSLEPGEDPYKGVEGIKFKADVGVTERLGTRADDSYYVTTEFYDCDFHLMVEGEDYDDVVRSGFSTYVIPSGFEGALIPKTGEKTLNWFSRDRGHHFRGWTFPIDDNYAPSAADAENGIPIVFENTDLSQTTDATAAEWAEGAWGNGYKLEQMIGAHEGPSIYVESGIYVPLHFKHIVSKVFLKDMRIIDSYNNVKTSDSKGVITFYGMPSQATLYPCARDKNGNYSEPKVVMKPEEGKDKWEYNPKSRVSYAITNRTQYFFWEGHTSTSSSYSEKDCWYVCPELDFSQMEFRIDIYSYNAGLGEWVLDPSHGMQGSYYGDFSNVKFTRTGSNRYDDPEGGDETILHAGEYLELTIYLYEKGNPSVQGTITSWSSRTGTGSSHVHQGIYSFDQLKEMVNVMKGSDEKALQEFYEMNGSGRDTGSDPEGVYPDYEDLYGQELKIIELFDDIGSDSYGTSTSNKLSSLEVADGYILDGQGHTVNVASSTLTLGPVRDIYIKYYSSGSSTASILYIDKNGDIWKVDHFSFVETPTGYNINDADSNPFQLTMSTGKVTPSKT